MAGYLNRVIHLKFPELAGTEDGTPEGRPIIWLTIRNPRLISGEEMMAGRGETRTGPDGSIIIGQDERQTTYAMFAKLIIGGNVLDPAVDSDDAPALPMPPSAETVGRYPIEVLSKLGTVLAEANPH